MNKILSVAVLSFMLLGSSHVFSAESSLSQMEVDTLERDIQSKDSEIESLGNLRDYYAARSTRLKNRADRYQFQNNAANLQEAKRLYKQAQDADFTVKKLDEEIEKREIERDDLERRLPKEEINTEGS